MRYESEVIHCKLLRLNWKLLTQIVFANKLQPKISGEKILRWEWTCKKILLYFLGKKPFTGGNFENLKFLLAKIWRTTNTLSRLLHLRDNVKSIKSIEFEPICCPMFSLRSRQREENKNLKKGRFRTFTLDDKTLMPKIGRDKKYAEIFSVLNTHSDWKEENFKWEDVS